MNPYLWIKDTLKGASAGAIVLASIGAVALFSATAFVVVSKIDNAVVQPQERQNLDQNANYRRSVEAQFRNAYAVYKNEVEAVTLDGENLTAFVSQNGPATSYPAYSQVANEYQQLFQAWTQDRQALVNAISDYNALCTNADTAPYRPSDLPASLSVPTPVVVEVTP